MGLVGRYFGHGDLAYIVSQPAQDDAEAAARLADAMEMVAQTEDVVNRLERSQQHVSNLGPLVTVYRSVISSSRAVLHWKSRKPALAASEALAVVRMGRASPVAKLLYMLSYATCLQLLRYLGYNDAVQEGLPNLEADASMYEIVQRWCVDLRRPLQHRAGIAAPEDEAISSEFAAEDAPTSPFSGIYHSSASDAPSSPRDAAGNYGQFGGASFFTTSGPMRPLVSPLDQNSANSSTQLSPVTPETNFAAVSVGETYAPVYSTPTADGSHGYSNFDFAPHASPFMFTSSALVPPHQQTPHRHSQLHPQQQHQGHLAHQAHLRHHQHHHSVSSVSSSSTAAPDSNAVFDPRQFWDQL